MHGSMHPAGAHGAARTAIQRVVPAMARLDGEENLAAVPSANPEPLASVLTTTDGHAVTSAITRIDCAILSHT